MTESDWLSAADVTPMLQFLRGRASDRKLRLFAVACCNTVRDLLTPEAEDALDAAGRVADGLVGPAERKTWRERAFHAPWVSDPTTAHRRGPAKDAVCAALERHAWDAAANAARQVIQIKTLEAVRPYVDNWSEHWPRERQLAESVLARKLRCIVSNPFRPGSPDRSWSTSSVVALAAAIYADRAFDRLPVLADALEEAGCDDPVALGHLRGGGPHARGCWVVDLMLQRS